MGARASKVSKASKEVTRKNNSLAKEMKQRDWTKRPVEDAWTSSAHDRIITRQLLMAAFISTLDQQIVSNMRQLHFQVQTLTPIVNSVLAFSESLIT